MFYGFAVLHDGYYGVSKTQVAGGLISEKFMWTNWVVYVRGYIGWICISIANLQRGGGIIAHLVRLCTNFRCKFYRCE